ncbi:MAG: type II toxin-antitoxin system RelE/ParE family toxin [Chitinophagaceae bacterium]|nr:MAG: type II toxin-antitoxin system RelE/ParE family toxin [Chitinophagaceae bacterium]
MAQMKIFWTATAIKQRNQVFEYWNDRNKSARYSGRLLSEINERINLLHTHPKLGRETDFKNTRVLSMGYYNIFYKTLDHRIIITAFWDTRQDPEKLVYLLK